MIKITIKIKTLPMPITDFITTLIVKQVVNYTATITSLTYHLFLKITPYFDEASNTDLKNNKYLKS